MEPKFLADLHEQANSEEFKAEIFELLSHCVDDPKTEMADFFNREYRNIDLFKLRNEIEKIKVFDIEDQNAKHLKRYFAARTILTIYPTDVFTEDSSCPTWLNKIFTDAAEGFYEYGKSQLSRMSEFFNELVNQICSSNYKMVSIIEFPLGNIIPIKILAPLFEKNGIEYEIINIATPRNEKKSKGVTYREKIKELKGIIYPESELVLFVDEIITGSRFSKTMKELLKVTKSMSIDFLAVGLISPLQYKLSKDQARIRTSVIKKLKDQSDSRIGSDHSNIVLPSLPKIKIDHGDPVTYESPLIWGEEDFVNGVRKVNLIFNLVEQCQYIFSELRQNTKILDLLKVILSRGTCGTEYITPEALFISVHSKIYRLINWEELYERTMTTFPEDYDGKINNLNFEEVGRRVDWIKNEVKRQVQQNKEEKLGQYAANCFSWIISASTPEMFCGPHRDYAYCNYTLAFNSCIRTFHDRFVCLASSLSS